MSTWNTSRPFIFGVTAALLATSLAACTVGNTSRQDHGTKPWVVNIEELTTGNKNLNHLVDREAVADDCDVNSARRGYWARGSSKG